ncbi:MAG: hypothetical protein GDA44_02305 [Prochloron sp. SP5CPC1]|nr:hypothetical protein [Candidatus Paraprochloron terpiosi SP5CPC1]
MEAENKELKQRVEILEGLLQETPRKPQPNPTPIPESGKKYSISRECRANDKPRYTDSYSNYSGQALNCFSTGHIAGVLVP